MEYAILQGADVNLPALLYYIGQRRLRIAP
jgi:hypothetical protein